LSSIYRTIKEIKIKSKLPIQKNAALKGFSDAKFGFYLSLDFGINPNFWIY